MGDSICVPAAPAADDLASSPASSPADSTATPAAEPATSPFVIAPAEATGRWVATAIGLGGAALVLVASLVVWALRDGEQPTETATAPAQSKPPMASAHAPSPDNPEPEAVTVLKPELNDPPASDELPDADPDAETIPDAPPELPNVETVGELPDAGDVAVAPTEPVEPTAEPTDEPPPAPIDPLDFDPGSLDLILTRGPRAEQKPAPEQPAAPEPQDDLAARLAARASAEPPEAVLDDRLGAMAQNARATVRRGPTGPPRPAPDDPLAIVIPEIAVADTPLDGAMRLLGELAGAPITVDPTALAYAAVPADRQVSLRGNSITIAELILQSASPLRLEIKQRGDQLILQRTGADAVRAKSYPVGDLMPTAAADATPVAELLRELLPTLRATIRTDGNKIAIDGPAGDHMQIAILCERLRKARDLEPRSRYPQPLLRTTPPLAKLDPLLDRKTTFTFVEFTPLAQVIDHWRRTTGLTILVDWASLADIDLTPRTTIACSVNDRPWRDALDSVLGGLDLAWGAVDDRTLRITTAAVANAVSYGVEFYPLDDATRVAPLREESMAWKAPTALHYDQASKSLVVGASHANQRRIWRRLSE